MATKKKENAVPEIIDNVEALEAKMKAMREAQKKFATYTQEQVDKIFFEAAMAANKMRIPLAKMAVEETGRGLVEDKIIKNHYAAEYIYNWSGSSGYPNYKPDINSNLQNINLFENKKCNHHQPTSGSKGMYNCSSKSCS